MRRAEAFTSSVSSLVIYEIFLPSTTSIMHCRISLISIFKDKKVQKHFPIRWNIDFVLLVFSPWWLPSICGDSLSLFLVCDACISGYRVNWTTTTYVSDFMYERILFNVCNFFLSDPLRKTQYKMGKEHQTKTWIWMFKKKCLEQGYFKK